MVDMNTTIFYAKFLETFDKPPSLYLIYKYPQLNDMTGLDYFKKYGEEKTMRFFKTYFKKENK